MIELPPRPSGFDASPFPEDSRFLYPVLDELSGSFPEPRIDTYTDKRAPNEETSTITDVEAQTNNEAVARPTKLSKELGAMAAAPETSITIPEQTLSIPTQSVNLGKVAVRKPASNRKTATTKRRPKESVPDSVEASSPEAADTLENEMTVAEEKELITNIRGGDLKESEAAFRTYWAAMAPRLFRRLSIGTPYVAREDIVQETGFKAWKAIKKGDFDKFARSSIGWLVKAANNTQIDEHRKAQVRPQAVSSDREDLEQLIGRENVSSDIETQVLKRVSLAGIISMLEGREDLSPGGKKINIEESLELLNLRFVQDLTSAQIAERTGLPEGTVKSRFYYLFKRFRAIYEEQDEIDAAKDTKHKDA